MTVWHTLLLAVTLCQGVLGDSVVFPTSGIQLDPPKECSNGANYCGGDNFDYPVEKIKEIVNKAAELRNSPENMDRFFSQLEPVPEDRLSDESLQDLEPACKSRRDMIPPRARAKNIAQKWMYLVEMADLADIAGGRTQQVEVNVCEDVDKPCKNSLDSPDEGSISCKQLFKTHKLLAFNEDGEIVVDTFELPSACICSYKRKMLGFRDGFGFDDTTTRAATKTETDLRAFKDITCPSGHKETEPLDTWSLEFKEKDAATGRWARYQRVELVPQDGACTRFNPNVTNVCEEHEQGYPKREILNLLRQSDTFRSPVHFKKLHDRPCEIEKSLTEFTNRIAFNPDEAPLCDAFSSYQYPEIARTVHGKWRYIINIDEYQQGVSMEICNKQIKDRACRYNGKEGNYPDDTICKQIYSRHNMLTVSPSRGVAYETFLFPSACICHLTKTYPF